MTVFQPGMSFARKLGMGKANIQSVSVGLGMISRYYSKKERIRVKADPQ